MKISDQLHGFRVTGISPKRMVVIYECQACGHRVRLMDCVPASSILRNHEAKHPQPIAWPFPLILDADGEPVSPVWCDVKLKTANTTTISRK